MSVSQLNIRLDSALKDAGDAALAEIGYTPTRFIRSIWEKLARRGGDREELKLVLEGHNDSSSSTGETRSEDGPLMSMLAMPSAIEAFFATRGASFGPGAASATANEAVHDVDETMAMQAAEDREQLWEAFEERWGAPHEA